MVKVTESNTPRSQKRSFINAFEEAFDESNVPDQETNASQLFENYLSPRNIKKSRRKKRTNNDTASIPGQALNATFEFSDATSEKVTVLVNAIKACGRAGGYLVNSLFLARTSQASTHTEATPTKKRKTSNDKSTQSSETADDISESIGILDKLELPAVRIPGAYDTEPELTDNAVDSHLHWDLDSTTKQEYLTTNYTDIVESVKTPSVDDSFSMTDNSTQLDEYKANQLFEGLRKQKFGILGNPDALLASSIAPTSRRSSHGFTSNLSKTQYKSSFPYVDSWYYKPSNVGLREQVHSKGVYANLYLKLAAQREQGDETVKGKSS